MIKLRHFWVFYLFSFLFLALLPILALLFNNGSMDFSAAAASATAATGVEWTSSIVNVLRLSAAEPVLLLSLLGSLAPAFAAVAVLLYLRDEQLWAAFRSRFRFFKDCGAEDAAVTYALMFVILVPCLFAAYEIRQALGGNYERDISLNVSLFMGILTIAFLDQGALLEEVGWRGFAGPELQKLLNNPLNAALVIGVCWGLWHLPRDITTGVIERLGLVVYLSQFLPAFLLGTISVSIIACYFMNRLGGSILAAIIVHGLTNDAIGIAGSATITEALTPFHQFTKNLPFALVAVVMVLLSGSQLGMRNRAENNLHQ